MSDINVDDQDQISLNVYVNNFLDDVKNASEISFYTKVFGRDI